MPGTGWPATLMMNRHKSSHASSEDSELIARVREGCEDAARQLVEHLRPRVIGLVRLHLPWGEDPADIAQDVFVKVFTKLHQYRGSAPFWNWVSQIAVRTCIDTIRARERRSAVNWSDLTDAQRESLEYWSDERSCGQRDIDAAEIVEKLIGALDPQERLLVRLLELEQHTPAEVAETTGWSSGLVRVRAYRARKKLKDLYQRMENSRPREET